MYICLFDIPVKSGLHVRSHLLLFASSFTLLPWRRKWQPTPVFLPGELHGQGSLAGYSPWVCKESDLTEQLTLSLSRYLGGVKCDHCVRRLESTKVRQKLLTASFNSIWSGFCILSWSQFAGPGMDT